MSNKKIDAATFELDAANITTAYKFGPVVNASLFNRWTAIMRSVTAGGSAQTSAQVKLQGSAHGNPAGTWIDLPLSDMSLTSPALASSLSLTTGASADLAIGGVFAGAYPYLRLAMKATGGAGIATEQLIGTLYADQQS